MDDFAKLSPEAQTWINYIDGFMKDANDVRTISENLTADVKKYVSGELYEKELWPNMAPYVEIQPVPDAERDALYNRLSAEMYLSPAGSAPAPPPPASTPGASTSAAPRAALPSSAYPSLANKSLSE